MKKYLSILLSLVMILSLAACSRSVESTKDVMIIDGQEVDCAELTADQRDQLDCIDLDSSEFATIDFPAYTTSWFNISNCSLSGTEKSGFVIDGTDVKMVPNDESVSKNLESLLSFADVICTVRGVLKEDENSYQIAYADFPSVEVSNLSDNVEIVEPSEQTSASTEVKGKKSFKAVFMDAYVDDPYYFELGFEKCMDAEDICVWVEAELYDNSEQGWITLEGIDHNYLECKMADPVIQMANFVNGEYEFQKASVPPEVGDVIDVCGYMTYDAKGQYWYLDNAYVFYQDTDGSDVTEIIGEFQQIPDESNTSSSNSDDLVPYYDQNGNYVGDYKESDGPMLRFNDGRTMSTQDYWNLMMGIQSGEFFEDLFKAGLGIK